MVNKPRYGLVTILCWLLASIHIKERFTTMKLTSNFYLIKGDNKPIYIGYTNNPIQQRFTEHKHDKDFSQYHSLSIELLKSLEFNVTWDLSLVQKQADVVDQIEQQFINQYHTQSSPYQKAIGGGQTWSNVKHFVRVNINNPKFTNKSDDDIQRYLDTYQNHYHYLFNFCRTIKNNPKNEYLRNFTTSIRFNNSQYLRSFISNLRSPNSAYLQTFTNTIFDPKNKYLDNFTKTIHDPSTDYLLHFTKIIEPKNQYLISFITSIKDPNTKYLESFIKHIDSPKTNYLLNFTRNLKK